MRKERVYKQGRFLMFSLKYVSEIHSIHEMTETDWLKKATSGYEATVTQFPSGFSVESRIHGSSLYHIVETLTLTQPSEVICG